MGTPDRSTRIVQATLNLWARLTLCPCRRIPYLDHRWRDVHIRNERDV